MSISVHTDLGSCIGHRIYIENNQMIVRNNLQKMAHQLASTQTGLKNLNERIKLISNKELIIEETLSDFIVKLPLLS